MVQLEDWAAPEHSRGRVNAAGATLVDAAASPAARRDALSVVNNWRAAHGLPLEVLQGRLSERTERLAKETLLARRSPSRVAWAANRTETFAKERLLAQRLKRLSSIEAKLRRARNMQLSQMQDVGGCRAILSTPEDVAKLARDGEQCGAGHELLRRYDYLAEPRKSSYRGVHLVFAYRPTGAGDTAYARMLRAHAYRNAVAVPLAACLGDCGGDRGHVSPDKP